MKEGREVVVRFVGFVAILVFCVVLAVQAWVFARCFFAVRAVPSFSAFPVVRVLFYGSGKGTVSARFSLFDTAGREFAVIDRSWTADSLSFDFTTASFGGKTFVFPFKIRPSEATAGGTSIAHYYLDRKQCMLLGEPCTEEQKHAFYHLALYALGMTRTFSSRFSEIRTLNLAQCEMGKTYDILTDSEGLLVLEPM